MKKYIIALALLAVGATVALATETTVYYTARTTASGANWAPPCWNGGPYATTSTGHSTAPGLPSAPGCFYHTASTMPTTAAWGCQLTSDTTVGQRWIVYIAQPSSNIATDTIVGISSTNSVLENPPGTAITQTDAFKSANSAGSLWGFVCYITPNTGAGFNGLHPEILFSYISGGTGGTLRMDADGIKFVPDLGCLATTAVTIAAPYITNMTSFTVGNVTAGATALAVYKQQGTETKTLIGFKSSGIAVGNNTVPLLGGATLEKNVHIWATQTVGGVEGCDHQPDYYVGIGNTTLKFSFNMRADAGDVGPIGAGGGISTSYGYYFMPSPSGNTVNYPTGGQDIPVSSCWQAVTIDPRTVQHGNTWINNGAWPAGDPWVSGRPAFGAVDSFCFAMSDTNSGPYEVYIDNLGSGATMIHDMEDYWTVGLPTTPPGNGLFTTFGNEGSTSPMLTGTTSPIAVSTIGCSTNVAAPNQAESGTNSHYVKWQWNVVGTSGSVWLRKLANAYQVPGWVSYPQVDLSKPIHFDILLAPLGSIPHAVGNVSWMDDVVGCQNSSVTFSITAQGPGDPANYGQSLTRTFTYQWKKNNVSLTGAGNNGTVTVNPTDAPATISYTIPSLAPTDAGTYSVVINDGTCSLTRSSILTVPSVLSITGEPVDSGPNCIGSAASFSVTGTIDPLCPCLNTPPLTYQWYFNGAPIAGATDSTYSFNGLTVDLTNAGSYTVVVSNTCASQTQTSTIAKLYVCDCNAATVQNCGTGLLGLYYTNRLYTSAAPFADPVTEQRVDANINFNWAAGSFDAGTYPNATDYFVVRWVGTIQGEHPGQTYTFHTTTDDGVRLWVDGNLLINKWVLEGATTWASAPVVLGATPVDVIMEYFENTGSAVAELGWESACTVSNIIPQSAFCAADPGAIPPFITLTSPANNSTAYLGNAVTLTATVTQETAPVTSVQFYNGATLLATVTQTGSGTYTRSTWVPPAIGVYNISALVNYGTSSKLYAVAVNKLTVTPPVKTSVHIDSIVDNGNGTVTINYSGGAGVSFTLMESSLVPNPTRDSWTVVGSDVTGTPGSFIAVPKAGASEFYTIRSN